MNMLDVVYVVGSAMFVTGVGVLAYLLASARPLVVSETGHRGYQRQRAQQSHLFATLEPLLCIAARWCSWLPLSGVRSALDRALEQAGNWKGLSANELVALSLALGATGTLVASLSFDEPAMVAVAGIAGLASPYGLLSGIRERRLLDVSRDLPRAIELIALCLSAGMDFPKAIQQFCGSSNEDTALKSELEQVLRDLDLGHSRRRALQRLSERVASDGVRDLVAAVVQSEDRGTPLVHVLQAQATSLKSRRSSRAEELAAQASVKMIVPLTILMFAILILVVAPLALDLSNRGL